MLKLSLIRPILVITVLGALSSYALAQTTQQSVSVPAAHIHFSDTGVGELKAAAGYGQMSQGAHGTFVKLPAGYSTPPHRHTGDYYAVVIQGVVANEKPNTKKDRPLAPGSYWFQQGNEDHVTKCLSNVDCVTFVSQSDKFDFIPAR